MRVGLQEEANIRMADAVADHLGVYSGFERTRGVGVPQIVERDPRWSRRCRETVETLPDGVRVWWAAILEREDVVTGVVVAAESVAIPVLAVTPGAEGGDRWLI